MRRMYNAVKVIPTSVATAHAVRTAWALWTGGLGSTYNTQAAQIQLSTNATLMFNRQTFHHYSYTLCHTS